MWNRITALFLKPGFKLDGAQRSLAVKAAAGLALLLVLTVGLFLGHHLRGGAPADDPRADLQLLAQAHTFRLPLVFGLTVVVATLAFWLIRVSERSSFGHQYLRWRIEGEAGQEDPENVPAARTLGGLIFAGLIFHGLCTLFATVVR